MYMPFDAQRKEMETLIWSIIKGDNFKTELSNYIRLEVEASKAKYSKSNNSNAMSYDMLTRGNVNMQARMAASGYDVYGRTIIQSNNAVNSSKNVYQKMKNKINYGIPTRSLENTGQRSFAKGG